MEDEDDIIFSDCLKLDNNKNDKDKENSVHYENKIKFIQRPDDKKKIGAHSLNMK
jgi:hypothetical protein